jgi:uncharacterized protein YbjT (DUF2867 family)
MTQRILLIGGHGKVALLAIPLLVEAGHQVDAVIRNPDHADDVRTAGATPVVADVERLDVGALTDLVRDHDVVIWSAGAGGGNPRRTYGVDRDAAIRSMDAAVAAGVRRYVMVSYFGASLDHGLPEHDSFFPYAEAKAAADEHLRRSDLDWTILAPSRLTLDPPTGAIQVGGAKGKVSRADVASVLVETIQRPGLVGRMVEFNNGDTPVAEALA